jgi:hypothetical protein
VCFLGEITSLGFIENQEYIKFFPKVRYGFRRQAAGFVVRKK